MNTTDNGLNLSANFATTTVNSTLKEEYFDSGVTSRNQHHTFTENLKVTDIAALIYGKMEEGELTTLEIDVARKFIRALCELGVTKYAGKGKPSEGKRGTCPDLYEIPNIIHIKLF